MMAIFLKANVMVMEYVYLINMLFMVKKFILDNLLKENSQDKLK